MRGIGNAPVLDTRGNGIEGPEPETLGTKKDTFGVGQRGPARVRTVWPSRRAVRWTAGLLWDWKDSIR